MASSDGNHPTAQAILLVGGISLVCLSLSILLGWYTQTATWIAFDPTPVAMGYHTALGFLFCGMGFLFLRFAQPGIASLFGAGALLLGGLTLIEYLYSVDLGISQRFIGQNTIKTAQSSQISPNTALCFTLTGIGMMSSWTLQHYKKHPHVAGILGALVFSLSIVALAGYFVGLETASGWGPLTQMALHTTIGFVITGISLIALAWSRDTEITTKFPDWFPILSGIGMITITYILWQTYDLSDAEHDAHPLSFSFRHAHDAFLVFGFILSGVMTSTLHYNQTAQRRLTQLKQEEEKTHRLLHTKNVLNALLQLAIKPHTLDQLLKISLDHILADTWITTLNKGAIFLHDRDSDQLVMRAHSGMDDPLLTLCARVSFGECLCGLVWETGTTLFSDSSDSRHTRRPFDMKPHCHYCVPIHSGDRFLGLFNLYLPAWHVRNEEEEEFLQMVANTLSWIIDHKQNEQNMIETTALINNILDSSPDLAIAATDQNFRITYYNAMAEKIFSYTKEQAIGQTVQAIHTKENVKPERFERAVDIVRREGIYRYTVTQEKEGKFSTVSSKVSGILNQTNDIIGYVLVSQDITEQKRMEETLRAAKERAEKSDRAKSAFLATMSHDIRTPMNAILGMGEVLKESGLNPEQHNFLQILTNSGKNLLALINDILDLSKVESGQLSIEALSFDLRQLVEETCHILLDTATAKNITIEYQVKPQCPGLVVGDPERMRQVLLNLIGNAIKFTEQGQIKLIVDYLGNDLIQFTLSDTGIGIPSTHIGQLFEPFKQANDSIARRFGGTGLGLSICKRLVEAMGGEIQVESTVGKGSVFRFTARLPKSIGLISDDTLTLITHEKENEPQQADSMAVSPLNILLVDDTEDNRLLVRAFLRKTPHQLTTAINGEEGVKMFLSRPFDLVLMDMQMPVLDGFGATQAIRQWEKEQGVPPTPIIALTANAMREDMERTAEVGCTLHISKPVKKPYLISMINQFAKG